MVILVISITRVLYIDGFMVSVFKFWQWGKTRQKYSPAMVLKRAGIPYLNADPTFYSSVILLKSCITTLNLRE